MYVHPHTTQRHVHMYVISGTHNIRGELARVHMHIHLRMCSVQKNLSLVDALGTA